MDLGGAVSPATGLLKSATDLETIVHETFPQNDLAFAVGYGSGVLSQHELQLDRNPLEPNESSGAETDADPSLDQDDKHKMVDLILGVKDAYRFHQENLQRNPDHYAGPCVLCRDKAQRIVAWQRHSWIDWTQACRNPRVYFNVVHQLKVHGHTQHLKYGVVEVDDLMDDLRNWRYIYLAGRLQKPVVNIVHRAELYASSVQDSILFQQQHSNVPAAVSASLLLNLLPHGSTAAGEMLTACFFTTLASLSYRGDPRMTVGAEDPDKIRKIVHGPGQLERFHRLYAPSLQQLEHEGLLSLQYQRDNNNQDVNLSSIPTGLSWDTTSIKGIKRLWQDLPAQFRRDHRLDETIDSVSGGYNEKSSLLVRNLTDSLELALRRTVGGAARYQSLKGLFTAGLLPSWKYARRKLSKGILSGTLRR